jgi:hypothetical protein
MSTSYANPGGTGSRTGLITVTTSGVSVSGSAVDLVNGVQGNTFFFNNATITSSFIVKFDFTAIGAIVIDEAKWYQDIATAEGVWKWQGSIDNATWADIGASFTLGGATVQTQSTLNGNTTPYAYYRLQGVSGSTSNAPWLREIEFKIEATPAGGGNAVVSAALLSAIVASPDSQAYVTENSLTALLSSPQSKAYASEISLTAIVSTFGFGSSPIAFFIF